jgi:hypothetical protein
VRKAVLAMEQLRPHGRLHLHCQLHHAILSDNHSGCGRNHRTAQRLVQ